VYCDLVGYDKWWSGDYPEDGGSMFLWNLRDQLPDKMKSYTRRPQTKSQPSQEHCSPSYLVTVITLYSLSNLYKIHIYLAHLLIQPSITHLLFLHSKADHTHLTHSLNVSIFTSVQGMCIDEVISLRYWNTVGYATTSNATTKLLSIKSGCYNERGKILSADIAHVCAWRVGPSCFDWSISHHLCCHL
jgi:hypothetical protein